MNNLLWNADLAALNKCISLNPGVLTYNGSSITVYKSAYRDYNTAMDSTGLSMDYDNLFIDARTSEISGWGLQPYVNAVTLDGVQFMTGKTITVNGPATTVWLRKRR